MNWLLDMPTEGTFLAVWQYDGKVWGRTVKIENGTYYTYDPSDDIWQRVSRDTIAPREVDYGMFVTPTV